MTEADRQKKIARALRKTVTEIHEVSRASEAAGFGADLKKKAAQLSARQSQLITLAEEFEQGRYLPREADAEVAVRDGENASPAPD